MQVNRTMLLLAMGALLAFATAAKDDEATKLGVVDVDQAISSTEEGKAAREELGRKQREAEAEIVPLYERFKGQRDDLESKKFVLSEDALYQKQLDLMETQNQIQNKEKELEGRLKVDRQRLLGPLTVKLREIIDEVGKEEGFTLIIGRGTPGVLYTREALDITDLVIEKYNSKS
jgi:outer membrane protein